MIEKLTLSKVNFEQAGLVVCSARLLTGINSNNGQLNDAQRRQFFKLVVTTPSPIMKRLSISTFGLIDGKTKVLCVSCRASRA